MMILLNKLKKKLSDLYSRKRFLLIVFVLVVALIIFGYFSDRGFVTKEPPANQEPKVEISQEKGCVPTSQDVEGPYFRSNAPVRTSIAPSDAKGERLLISGTIYHSDCKTPVTQLSSGVPQIEVWQADNVGEYDNKSSNYWYRGTIPVDSNGHYQFETIRPGNYLDGGGFRPAHIHFKVRVPGYRPLTTQLYFKDDPYLGSNDSCGPCNSENHTLIIDLQKRKIADRDEPQVKIFEFYTGIFDIILEPIEPQKFDTSTWQTYRNDEFGFEVKYPGDWEIVDWNIKQPPGYPALRKISIYPEHTLKNSSPIPYSQFNSFSGLPEVSISQFDPLFSSRTEVSIFPLGWGSSPFDGSGFSMKVFDYTRDLVLADGKRWARFIGGFEESPLGWDGFVWGSVEVTNLRKVCVIQGVDVKKFPDGCPDYWSLSDIVSRYGRDVISVYGDVNEATRNVVETILSTFRFLRFASIADIDTSDWQTYRSETFGFEFKYPGDWEVGRDLRSLSIAAHGLGVIEIDWFDSNNRDISFCEDYLTGIGSTALGQTSRCERFTVDGIPIPGVIDWGVSSGLANALFDDGSSSLSVTAGNSGGVDYGPFDDPSSFDYGPKGKVFFKAFLSTFRFLESQEATILANCRVGKPTITSISLDSGPIGTEVEIRGCNFAGFEGDLNAWIENNQGVSGILRGQEGSTSKLIKIILRSPLCQSDNSYSGIPCKEWLTLTLGTYKIYIEAWGQTSNEAIFTIE